MRGIVKWRLQKQEQRRGSPKKKWRFWKIVVFGQHFPCQNSLHLTHSITSSYSLFLTTVLVTFLLLPFPVLHSFFTHKSSQSCPPLHCNIFPNVSAPLLMVFLECLSPAGNFVPSFPRVPFRTKLWTMTFVCSASLLWIEFLVRNCFMLITIPLFCLAHSWSTHKALAAVAKAFLFVYGEKPFWSIFREGRKKENYTNWKRCKTKRREITFLEPVMENKTDKLGKGVNDTLFKENEWKRERENSGARIWIAPRTSMERERLACCVMLCKKWRKTGVRKIVSPANSSEQERIWWRFGWRRGDK